MQLEREGIFRAKIWGCGINASNREGSDSMWLEISCFCLAEFHKDTKTWIDLPAPHPEVSGMIFIVGKDGSRMHGNSEEFEFATGWDGTLEQIGQTDPPWEPKDIEITVREDNYKGETKFRIDRVSKIVESGKPAGIPPSKLARLKAKWEASKEKKAAPKDQATFQPPSGEVPF